MAAAGMPRIRRSPYSVRARRETRAAGDPLALPPSVFEHRSGRARFAGYCRCSPPSRSVTETFWHDSRLSRPSQNCGRQRAAFASFPAPGMLAVRIALRRATKRFPAHTRQCSVSIPAGHFQLSPALRLASSAASHGLIWPGPASPRPALPQRLMQTFFPWASPIPRETRKSARRRPPLRSGSFKDCCVRSRRACRSPSRPRWSRARKPKGELTWPPSEPSRKPATNMSAKS